MSHQYDQYLNRHKSNVKKGFDWIRDNLPELIKTGFDFEWRIGLNHDYSKTEQDEYILEMICNWWAFSWAKGNLKEIFPWYEDHKDYIKLHPNTRKTVESILDQIKIKLEETK